MGGDPVQGGAPSVGGGGPIEVDEHPTFDGFDAENILGTSFLLRWSAASDNETPSRELVYDVYLSETAGTPQLYLTTEPGAIQVRLQNLERSTTYYVLVRARDEDNNWSENDAELAVTTTTDVSLKFDIHPIFAVKCATAGCHTGIAAVGNLRLDPGWAWTALVDVVSTSDSTKKRVAPGDLEGSRLYETLTATDSWRMPPVGSLSAEEQSLIADWITQGALNN